MAQNYLVTSWKAMLQMIVNLCGKGYYYYHLTELPINKQNKWGKIDSKIIQKYQTDKSKWQRQRQKRNGIANFYYLRWEHIFVVLRTEGTIFASIMYDDKFSDIRKSPISLKITSLTTFKIQFFKQKKITVYLSGDTYKGLKDNLYDVAKTKNISKIKQAFNQLNGYPAYQGILEQKNQLATFLILQSKKHNCRLKRNELRFHTQKRTLKNYYEAEEESSL